MSRPSNTYRRVEKKKKTKKEEIGSTESIVQRALRPRATRVKFAARRACARTPTLVSETKRAIETKHVVLLLDAYRSQQPGARALNLSLDPYHAPDRSSQRFTDN